MDYAKQSKDELILEIKNLKKEFKAFKNATADFYKDVQELKKTKKKFKKHISTNKHADDYINSIEEKIDERTFELTILNEISNKVAYVLNYEHLFELVMESVYKVVEYDICAALLFDYQSANITFNLPYLESSKFTDEIKDILLETFSCVGFEKNIFDNINTYFVSFRPELRFSERRQFETMHSFLSAPLIINKQHIGGIIIASCKKNAFKQSEARVFHTLVNLTNNAIERLQLIKNVEKTKMASMVESMHQGVIMLDEKGKIIVLNPKAKELFGFDVDTHIDSSGLKKKLKSIHLEKAINECIYKQHLSTVDIAVELEKTHILQCEVSPVRNVKRELIGVVVVMTDITKMREIERMKTEFVSVISHELRTPLTTIREGVSLLLDDALGEITKQQKEFMEMVLKDVDRLRWIVDDLLNVSSLESRQSNLNKDLVDVVHLVKRCCLSFKATMEKKGLNLKVDCAEKELLSMVDENKLIQVITNLLGNALNFTEKGNITFSVEDKNKYVEFAVLDTGKGIASSDLVKVFDRFHQVGRENGPGYRGTGLGLAIVKEIVSLHGGQIWVESVLGQGAKFIFTIPKYDKTEEIIYDNLEMKITLAKREKKKFMVLVMKLDNYFSLDQSSWLEKREKIIRELEEKLKQQKDIGRFVFLDRIGDIVVLIDEAEGTLAEVEVNLKRQVKQIIFSCEEQVKVDFLYGVAIYPDDASDSLRLLYFARKRMSSERRERMQKKIMIVDDNISVRTTLVELLTALGYTNIVQFACGEDALAKLNIESTDLLILDISLSGMDGYEVIKHVREDKQKEKLNILIVSGYEIESKLSGKSFSYEEIPRIAKPFDIKLLEKYVAYLL